ncbi:MAG: sulfatase, partial [Planctomycetota bacterium]
VLVLPAGPSAIAADPRPNILLVLTDDHSVPHIGCYGNADVRTPHLDRFATRGMRFDRMYVTAPQCVPARATIMTGQSSVKIGMTRFSAPLARDVLTFPELLRDAGYRTGLVGRTYHLDGHDVIASKETKRVFSEHDLVTFPDRVDFVRIAQGGVGHVDQMAEFLDGTTADRPWFLQLSFDDPHRPLSVDAIDEPHDPREINLPTFMPDTDAVRADLARYYDEVARFDADFGRAMRLLADRGLDGTTCVIFMGDNGAALLRGKGTLYELGLHVPMLVCWEGVVTAGSHAADLISSEDIAPTLLEIAGVSAADGMDGVSFASLLRGKKFYGRKSLCAARGAHGYNLPLNTADLDLSRCVVTDRYKLIYNPL